MAALRFGREIRLLLQAAMLLFLVTIGLGMARGLGFIDFTAENEVMTHLHAGVVGWITLGILACGLWLYGGEEPSSGGEPWVTATSGLLVVAVVIFAVAWWLDNVTLLAIGGAGVLFGILLYVGWLVGEAGRIGYRHLTTPQLGLLLALVALIAGSSIGVLIAAGDAWGILEMPESTHLAHAETQISAYLILAAMSFAYWRLHGNDQTPRGTWMVWLFFAGGAVVAVSLLANVLEGTIAYIPLDVTAFILLLSLIGPRVLMPGWLHAGSARHYAIAIPFAVAYLAIFIYLVLGLVVLKIWSDPGQIPFSIIASSSHLLFLGVVTNTLLGVLLDLEGEARAIAGWVDHVVFWGMNVAVALFSVAIQLEQEWAFPAITSLLGLSLAIGLAVHLVRTLPSIRRTPAALGSPVN